MRNASSLASRRRIAFWLKRETAAALGFPVDMTDKSGMLLALRSGLLMPKESKARDFGNNY